MFCNSLSGVEGANIRVYDQSWYISRISIATPAGTVTCQTGTWIVLVPARTASVMSISTVPNIAPCLSTRADSFSSLFKWRFRERGIRRVERKRTRVRRGYTRIAAARNGRTTCAVYEMNEMPNAPVRTKFVGLEETKTTEAAK